MKEGERIKLLKVFFAHFIKTYY